MQFGKRMATVGATIALLFAGLFATATSASAAPANASDDGDVQAQTRWVVPWTDGPWRNTAHTLGSVVRQAKKDYTYQVTCWVYGQNITRYGITNNVWVWEQNSDSFIWAGLLRGGKYADLGRGAEC